MTAIRTRASRASCDSDSTTPPIAIIGAEIAMPSSMLSTCCTCVVSLVVLVMSDAVLKCANWCTEKCATRRKMRSRTTRPKPVATLAEKKLPATAQAVPSTATTSIRPPICRIVVVSPGTMP